MSTDTQSRPFTAFGTTYPSEREAIIGLMDSIQVAEACAGRALAAGPTRAFAELKTLLRASPGARLGEQMLAETAAICRTAGTRDAASAIAGFPARSRTDFQGW